jgi:23S rRNA (uracil-5-)-methyltransferase RumA
MEPLLQKNKTILLTIKRLGINGEGIGYYKRQAVFVKGLIPPEEAIVRITDVKPTYSIGEIVSIRIKAAKRAKPFCPHYQSCGGCQTQHIQYDEQLLLKEEMLKQTIERYAGITEKETTFLDIQGMDIPRHYRYKSQMPVANTKSGLTTGFYKPNTQELVPVSTCPIHSNKINTINQKVVEICEKHDIRAFDPSSMRGLLRYIVTRESYLTGEIQVTLVITIFNKALYDVAKEIMEIPGVIGVGISKNHDKKNNEIFGKEVEILEGSDYVKEGIGDIVYELKPKAFYQLNPKQAIVLYEYIKSLLDFNTDKVIIDAYSGAGAIALYLAPYATKVIGIDYSKESIYSALHNKKKNQFKNVDFIEGKTHLILPKIRKNGTNPDVLIIDPPRSGLDKDTVDHLIKNPIKKIVYVSCNHSTLGKNLKILKSIYNIKSIKAFDMFPQTSHIESVTLLTLKNT